jgi:hypothetical protein
MNKAIYKYPIQVTDTQSIHLPLGSEILTIQTENNEPHLWALVDPSEKDTEGVIIEIFGTGHPIGYDMGVSREYISTFQLHKGIVVFHAFKYTGI